MHSSIKSSRSNKSISQESLIRFNASVRAKNLQANSSANRLKKPVAQQLLSSNEHSPGSATTATKSSRLSSVNSATTSSCSPRDATIQRNGLAVSAPLRRSFVSPKSREILAAKKGTINQTEPPRSTTIQSSSTSNAAMKRPVSFPTTLHLRRTAKLSPSQVEVVGASPATSSKSLKSPFTPNGANRTKADQSKAKPMSVSKTVAGRRFETQTPKVDAKTVTTSANNRIKGNVTKNTTVSAPKALKAPHEVKLVIPPATDAEAADDDFEYVSPRAATRVESKLERSSTFCKDSTSELDSTTAVVEMKIVE